MNQVEYEQVLEEMLIPASKILTWAKVIQQEYYQQYKQANRNLFDRILESAYKLVEQLPIYQKLGGEFERVQAITHGVAGPIIVIRDYTILILADPDWNAEAKQSEEERDNMLYLKKINSAAEYLASLDRDAALRMMLDEIDHEE